MVVTEVAAESKASEAVEMGPPVVTGLARDLAPPTASPLLDAETSVFMAVGVGDGEFVVVRGDVGEES